MKKAYRNLTTSRVTMRLMGTMFVKMRIQVKYLWIALRTQFESKTDTWPNYSVSYRYGMVAE